MTSSLPSASIRSSEAPANRRPRARLCVLAALALTALAAAPSQARTVRVFAMQPKLDLAWMQSRQSFHDKMLALTDASMRGPGTPLVQRGADDMASHRLGSRRDLVVWPEDIGLFGALTGQRAASAR